MEQQITITKISLNGGMFPVVSYKEHLPGNDERVHSSVKCTAPAHVDLIKAFKDFTLPLALICEQITNEQYIDALPNEYDPAQPDEIELGEIVPAIKATKNKKAKKDGLNVTMIGKYGAEKNISSLFGSAPVEDKLEDKFDISCVEFKYQSGIETIALSGSKELSTKKWMGLSAPAVKMDDPDYAYTEDLFQAGELLKYEIGEYIVNHKYAPPVDPELPFGDGLAEGEDSLFDNTKEEQY